MPSDTNPYKYVRVQDSEFWRHSFPISHVILTVKDTGCRWHWRQKQLRGTSLFPSVLHSLTLPAGSLHGAIASRRLSKRFWREYSVACDIEGSLARCVWWWKSGMMGIFRSRWEFRRWILNWNFSRDARKIWSRRLESTWLHANA